MEHHASLQLTTPGSRYSARQKTGLALIGVGVLALLVMLVGDGSLNPRAHDGGSDGRFSGG